MVALIRRLAIPVAVCSIVVNALMLLVSLAIWVLAGVKGWLDDVAFVAHVSMLALVFAAVSGVAAALAGLLVLIPTDDLIEVADEEG